MPSGEYEIILADFPWSYTSFGTAKLPYKQMSTEDICAFDWSQYMAKRCVLFSWATGPKMHLAFQAAEAWKRNHGLHYQGIPYVWIKTKLNGEPIKASGPRPRLVKPLDEFVLAFSNVPNARCFKLLTERQVQNVFAPKVKRGEHSSKPAVVRDMIVELLGDRPRIELFARERTAGWHAHGDELPMENV